jgi:acyl-CoA synthetase (AMP-forming)/AMP-acid ligase II
MDKAIHTTAQRLALHARRQPEVRAITDGRIDCSYRRLAVHVVQMLDALADAGIRRGQVVGVEAGDRFLHLLLLLACEAMGAATISLSSFELAPEVDLGRFCDRILAMRAPAGGDTLMQTPPGGPAMQTPPGGDAGKFFILTQDWLTRVLQAPVGDDRFDALERPVDPDSLVRLIKSSGTTGNPKVMGMTYRVQQRTIRNNLLHAADHFGSRPNYLCLYPFSLRGCHSRALLTLQRGGTIHLAAMDSALDLITAGAVDYALFVTGDLERFVLDPRLVGGPFGVQVDVIGAAMSSQLRNKIAQTVTEHVAVTYGTNEVHHVSIVDADNVGTLFPNVEVMIVDDHGRRVPPGDAGLIRIRSDTMTDGYLGAPALTAATFLDGWYHTSDLGFQPSPGTLVVLGRADDMLNVGGMKVPPGPVAEQIRTIDGVLDAMVTRVVNAKGVEVLLVAVETGLDGDTAGLEAAINPIIQRYASRYVLLPMAVFPRTETRKIRLDAVRAAYANRR